MGLGSFLKQGTRTRAHTYARAHTLNMQRKETKSVSSKLNFCSVKKKKTVEKINRQVTVWEKIICKTHLRRLTSRTEDSWSSIIKSPQEPRETRPGRQDAPVGSSRQNAHSPQGQAPHAQQNGQDCRTGVPEGLRATPTPPRCRGRKRTTTGEERLGAACKTKHTPAL